MDRYAFTIKVFKNSDNCNLLYDDILKTWKIQFGCKIIKVVIEKDSKGVPHVHGTVEIPKNLLRKKLCFSEVVHTCFKNIYNEEGWEDYIGKDQLCSPTSICKHDDYCVMVRLRKKLF